MLSRFHTIPACYGQTDGQTELLYQYRASAAVCWRAVKTVQINRAVIWFEPSNYRYGMDGWYRLRGSGLHFNDFSYRCGQWFTPNLTTVTLYSTTVFQTFINSVVFLEESPCSRGSSRTNLGLQLLVPVLVLGHKSLSLDHKVLENWQGLRIPQTLQRSPMSATLINKSAKINPEPSSNQIKSNQQLI